MIFSKKSKNEVPRVMQPLIIGPEGVGKGSRKKICTPLSSGFGLWTLGGWAELHRMEWRETTNFLWLTDCPPCFPTSFQNVWMDDDGMMG